MNANRAFRSIERSFLDGPDLGDFLCVACGEHVESVDGRTRCEDCATALAAADEAECDGEADLAADEEFTARCDARRDEAMEHQFASEDRPFAHRAAA